MILNYLPTECQSVMKDVLSFCLDIYGLLLFLGVDPYCHQKWWKSLLFEPYRNGNKQPLYELLAKILWRSVKKDVIHEVLFSKVFVCVILRKGISTSYWWKGGGGCKAEYKTAPYRGANAIKFFTFSPNPEMSPQIDNWVTLLHLT